MRIQWPKWALAYLFLADGTGFGLWAAHVPVFKQNLHLSNGALSRVLLSLVGGAIVTMPITGHLIAHFNSRTVVRVAALCYVVMLAFLAQANSFGLLVLFAGLYGGAKGALDVSVNAQAVAVEHHYGRSSTSLFQGCWSVGGLIGAGVTSLLLKHGMTLRFNLSAGAIILAATVLAMLPVLIVEQRKEHEAKARLVLPDAALLRLALIAFFGLFAEGAIGDWAAVYLRSNMGASLSLAAAGYATYAIAMASARFLGEWLTRRFEDRTILIGSGLLIALGFGCTLLSPSLAAAVVGLALTGMGVANIFPVIVTLAGRNKKMGTGPAISALSTIGYFGFLAGPPLIGWLAVVVGLQWALGMIVLAGVIVAAGPVILSMKKEGVEVKVC
ncbi:MFS transporter [Edaphobacter albus]|uniref:MFS transporter n=1 Tax=Edaphobacter sp. 4G125 TaxID=2763071 RepID=UPI0016455CF4|nr:MFS transporter [Edaphobacter sp. 4G125]QNI35372.1 MFS transporter [Edaphobacter sp. 4G125]